MNDGESLSLQFFGKDELPEKIEKRAKELLESLGETLWKMDCSFPEALVDGINGSLLARTAVSGGRRKLD